MTQDEMNVLFDVAEPVNGDEGQPPVTEVVADVAQLLIGDEVRKRYDALPWQARMHTPLEEYADIHSSHR